ncbi:MAG: hypothetical protein EU532_10000 [Promethearchaeota archaeon]|nr:MAG: hypothetical protein EU532_10000 [Candidatus Lokiarchaeota archaeon]
MFNLEDFSDYEEFEPLVIRLNKFLNKDKITKVSKIVSEIEELLDEKELCIPSTYVLSILAENYIELISEDIIKKIESFLKTNNEKLQLNSIIILGFFILKNPSFSEKYFSIFIHFLIDPSEDLRDNAHYFLQEFVKTNPKLLNTHANGLIKALKLETKKENINSLLKFFNNIQNLDFKQLYCFRTRLKELISTNILYESPEILNTIDILIKRYFPSLIELDLNSVRSSELIKLLDDQFLMKKQNVSKIGKEKNISIKNYLEKIKKSRLKEIEIYFYLKDRKKNEIYFYELEKDKLIDVFTKNKKISIQKLHDSFSSIIEDDFELKNFIGILLKLGIIDGYLSEFYFYPYEYLKSDIINRFQSRGVINVKKNYDYLPPDLVHKIIMEMNQEYLMGKKGQVYYSLKKIKQQINRVAANNSIIDLRSYRERLSEEDFIKLIKKLPKDYLTNFHKGTSWLTNIGKIRIEDELRNSKLIGFIDIEKISEKLKINKLLFMDVIYLNIDQRSGIWDNNKEIFYFSKYIKDRIEEINLISNEAEKEDRINKIAGELNIEKNHILTKIDENIRLIGEEIRNQDLIKISEYLEKTGFKTEEKFLEFVNSLDLNYFKKADQLILNPKKIEESKNSIKLNLIERSKYEDFISLGNFDINLDLIRELIQDLKQEDKLKGIFHEETDEIIFYTIKGIRNLMIENNFLFSFEDLFYGKELDEEEIILLREILESLIKEKKLKGTFDPETNTFSSEELLFEFDYNRAVDDFRKAVNNYIKRFKSEFAKIKKILSKRNETIFPLEIKVIQDSLDKININYVKWRAQLNAYISEANKKLLKEQGYNLKRYLNLSTEKKKEIKIFKEDPDIYEILNDFSGWIEQFNELEQNYGKIIFLQKRLINNPNDGDTKNKLDELSKKLNMVF